MGANIPSSGVRKALIKNNAAVRKACEALLELCSEYELDDEELESVSHVIAMLVRVSAHNVRMNRSKKKLPKET